MFGSLKAGGVYAFVYTNWKGERAPRLAQFEGVQFGSNEYHPEPQFFLKMLCLERGEIRSFAIKDIEPTTFAEKVIPT